MMKKHSQRNFVFLFIFGMIFIRSGLSWAGGNIQFRDPTNASHIINKVWDERMLPVTWVLSDEGLPGSGIGNESLIGEITTAFNSWENISTSKIDFEFGGEVPISESGLDGPLGPGIDGHNLLTFTDSDMYFPLGVLAYAITFSFTNDTVITDANNDLDDDGVPDIPNGTYPAGTIFDGDITFNSSEPWSVSGADGSIDIQAVSLHEIGHLIGLSHSSIRNAVMWPFLNYDISAARTLTPDDVAYASLFYQKDPEYSILFGSITGRIINGFSNASVLGAHVYAVNPLNGESIVGAYSGDDGSYLIPGLSAGNYLVAIEPLDGDPVGLDPFRINQVIQYTFDTNFSEEFYDANESAVEADPLAGLQVQVSAGGSTADIDIVTNTVEVPGVNLILSQGYGLFSYPVEVPLSLGAFDLLGALGDSSDVNAIDRFVPGTSTFERAEYVNDLPRGVNFPIKRGEGYVLHMDNQKVVNFSGGIDCPLLNLHRGLNLVGISCPPAGYTAYSLIQDIGASHEVTGIKRFDPETGNYETVSYDSNGLPVGDDFPVINGEGYIVTMNGDKSGVRIPAVGNSFAPVITGISPGRGVAGTIVVILGEGFNPDVTQNTVSFNGIGAGIIFATSTSLTVTVPASATTGPIIVTAGGLQSNSVDFIVENNVVSEEMADGLDLISGQSVDGEITIDGEQDRYQFTALSGSLVTVSAEAITPGVPDLVLLLENPFGALLATDDNSAGGTDPLINNFVLENTGTHTIVVSNLPQSGLGSYRLHLTITNRTAPSQVSILGGNFQTGLAGSTLTEPLSVFVTGPTGNALAGSPVTFVASGIDIFNAGTLIVSTNASGIATIATSLPSASGAYSITVTAQGASPVTFTLAATSTAVASITMNGDRQDGVVGNTLSSPLEIVLKDVNDQPVPNAIVGFLVAAGGGMVSAASGGVSTDANGSASTTFTLGTKIDTPQLVAAFVPGSTEPLLFEAIPKAGSPASVRSNQSNFNLMTLGSSRLNAFQIEVYDQYDNPVEGALIDYSVPNGLYVYPGLGPEGQFFTDLRTNKKGLNVAMLSVPETVIPTIDEFGNKGDSNLSSTYTVTATVSGHGLSQAYTIDVDMGPNMVTYSTQNDSELIGQSLEDPVKKRVYRYQRSDTYTDTDDDDKDDDNGDFRDENFDSVVFKPVEGVVVELSVKREDGKTESGGFQPTRTDETSLTTDSAGIVSTDVTMGDVGGVSHVVGKIDSIPVTWYFNDGTELNSKTFTEDKKFAESTNLVAIPVIVAATLSDTTGGMDFSSINVQLNGVTFFDGGSPPAVMPDFPEKLEIIAGGTVLDSINSNIVGNSAFSSVKIIYYPGAPTLASGSNTVTVLKAKDTSGKEQDTIKTLNFTFP